MRVNWRLVALGGALIALAVVVHWPHDNFVTGAQNPFPVHADEYVHWGYAQAIVKTGLLFPPDPFTGDAPPSESGAQLNERGFQAYVGVLQGVTGIDWVPLFGWAPVAVAMLLALCVFALAERWGAGVEAVLFLLAVPTTVRFLGPGYFVPIAFSLPLLVLGLFLLVHEPRPGAVVMISIIAGALWSIHAFAAVILVVAAILYAGALASRQPVRALQLAGAVALPLLLAHRVYPALLDQATHQPEISPDLDAFLLFGAIPLFAAAVGAAILAASRDAQRAAAALTLGTVMYLLELVLVIRMTTGTDPFRLYDRSTLGVALFASIFAGVALATVLRKAARWLARPGAWKPVGAAVVVLALVGVGYTVASSVHGQAISRTYVVLTQPEYDAYVTAAAQLGPLHQRALVGSVPTMPFSIITGLPTLFVRSPETTQEPGYVVDFFREGGNDTHLLVASRTGVVVSDRALTNPDLHPIAPGVYVLRDDYLARMAQP